MAASRCSPPTLSKYTSIGRVLLEELADRAVVVVEGRVEPEVAGHPGDLLRRAGRPHDLGGAEQSRHLAGRRADGTGGAGHEHGLALLDRRDAREADVRRHPRHAEHAEVRRGRHPLDVDDADLTGRAAGRARASRPGAARSRRRGPARRRRRGPRRRRRPRAARRGGTAGRRTGCRSSGRACRGPPTGRCCAPAPRRGRDRPARSSRCGSRRAWASRTGGRPGGSPGWEWSCSRSCPTPSTGCRRSRRRRLGRAFRHP